MLGAPGFLLLLSVASLTSALQRPMRGTVPFRPGPDLALVEGDVAVPVSQGGGHTRDTFVTDPSHLWSNGRVYYTFEKDEWNGVVLPIFTDTQMDRIKAIFGDIEREIPCFKFVEKPSSYRGAHLIFTSMGDAQNHPSGCYSYVGRQGAMDGTPGQVINLGSPGCFSKGRILHEVLHGLGASHEHNRADRDRYVIVHMDNVDPNKAASIMMYGEDAFGINGTVTIAALKPGKIRDPKTRSTMTVIDKIELGRAYSSVTSDTCFTPENLKLYAEEADRRRERAEEGWRKAEEKLRVLESTCKEHTVEHLSVVLESTGAAAEWQGNTLGEFQLHGSYGGRPSYVQWDTEGSEDLFLYYNSGKWRVGDTVGNTIAYLKNNQDTQATPTNKWEHWDGSAWHEDPSVVLRGGHIEPCREVKVSATGEARRLQGESLGSYLPTGGWSEGRPVYRQDGGLRRYLLVEGGTAWSVRSTPQSSGAWISSGRGTSSPGDRQAGPSDRLGVTRWRYWDGVSWKEGDITVSCVF